MNDAHWMNLALEEARKGVGKTAPNPPVGAVIVKNGRVIGEGYHRRAGTPHAECHALREAGARARGATLYVTLEPCCHQGRTPPCVDAIVDAKIARVVVGMRDPNPLVNGRGNAALKRAGIAVSTGVRRDECQALNRPYEKLITQGVPYVILKAALSLDGKIATATGVSKWITRAASRKYVHELRRGVDAVMIGAGTLTCDDPALTARRGNTCVKTPRAVVLDETLVSSDDARLFSRAPGELTVATTARAPAEKIEALRMRGHEVIVCAQDTHGRVALRDLMRALGARGVMSVLVEGGGEVFASVIAERLADRVVACVAPTFIGGEGKNMLPGMSIGTMDEAVHLEDVTIRTLGRDVVIEGNLK